jgi:hypothetical protein
MKFAAIFSILVGGGMFTQWTMSYFSHQILELKTEPIRIGFHLAGEMATALTLVISGIGLLSQATWSLTLFYVASGMLLYTAIVSPGYFAQKGQWIWIAVFGVLIALTVASLWIVAG